MSIKQNISDKQLLLLIKELLSKYPDAYTDEEVSHIMHNYKWIKYNNHYDYILREIYDEVGVIKEEDNLYLKFMSLIEEKFGIDKNIVEVGGGIIPILSKYIALRQLAGTVTVFDPRLAIEDSKISNLKLKKEKFTLDKMPSNTGLIIGLHPYGGTESAIEVACKNDIDFIIALGDLPININSFIDEELYDIQKQHLIYDAKRLVEENNLGTFQRENLDICGDTYQIIYNKRK